MRSRLGLSWEECSGLPWWQYQAYLDGLDWDLAREAGQEREKVEHTDDLAALGFDVRTVA